MAILRACSVIFNNLPYFSDEDWNEYAKEVLAVLNRNNSLDIGNLRTQEEEPEEEIFEDKNNSSDLEVAFAISKSSKNTSTCSKITSPITMPTPKTKKKNTMTRNRKTRINKRNSMTGSDIIQVLTSRTSRVNKSSLLKMILKPRPRTM